MKNSDIKKLAKALELIKKAQELLTKLDDSSEDFRYSSNANFRRNRLDSVESILSSDLREFGNE